MDYKLSFQKFDPSKMKNFNISLMVCRRGGGKSFLIKDIIYKNRHKYTDASIICPTNKNNQSYTGIVPDSYIYDDFNPSIINKLFERQDKILSENKVRKKNNKSEKKLNTLCISDDCAFDKKIFSSKEVTEIYFNARHKKIEYIQAVQFSLTLPPSLRANIDYIFLLGDNSYSNKKRLYDHYCSNFNSFKLFNNVFNSMTENYGCMVIDNTSRSNKLTDCIYWYRAEDTPPFRIGNSGYWKYHHRKYDKNYNKKDNQIDVKNIKGNENNILISCKE